MSQEKTEPQKKKFNRDLVKKPPEGFPARLSDFINYINIEQQKLAEVGGVTPPSITAYRNGSSQPAAGVVARWVQVFRVNANWLLTGEGAMLLDSPQTSAEPKQPEETQVAREMRDIEQKLTALGAGPEEVKRAIMAHLGVHAPISLAGYGTDVSERNRVRSTVQEPAQKFGKKDDDPDDPMK
ncbi:MAG: helix-turn-helix domain-containing protein [Desulfovibrio sp.]|nr:helix-turn-helix domain-containing protein [Desulfovibrio sp.]